MMSYCAIIPFKDGKPESRVEFRNAWGGAAYIWDCLFKKHLKDPAIPHDSWLVCTMRGDDRLWKFLFTEEN